MLRTLGVLAAALLLGVGATQMLHQAEAFQTAHAEAAKPPGYVVFEVDVKDRDGYSNVFLPDAYKGIHAHGGKLMAGGYDKGVTSPVFRPPTALASWPSRMWTKPRFGFRSKKSCGERSPPSSPISEFTQLRA
jgi:hypothetical protein